MKLKILAADTLPGMYVCELDRPWLETPFLFQGFKIQSQQDVKQLLSYCQHVFIDADKSDQQVLHKLVVLSDASAEKDEHRHHNTLTFSTHDLEPDEFKKQLRRCRITFNNTRHYIVEALEDARLGQSINTQDAKTLVNELTQQVVTEPSALMWLTHLKKRDEYTSNHCVNVCILAINFARHLGYPPKELNIIGLGALLHDLGKLRIPLEILNKPGRLTPQEFEIIKAHPRLGHALLTHDKKLDKRTRDIVLYHHERPDGRGYPEGLSSEQVHRYTKIVSVADVYDAISSDRVYHDGYSPHTALRKMYEWVPGQFDGELMEAFIQCIGIYPIGSIIRLNTQQIGVVVQLNQSQKLKPTVLLLVDSFGQPYAVPRLVNLASTSWDKANTHFTIQDILEPGAYNLDVRQIIERFSGNTDQN